MSIGVSAASVANIMMQDIDWMSERIQVYDLGRCLYRQNCITLGIYFTKPVEGEGLDTCTI